MKQGSASRPSESVASNWRVYWKHLRVPFQLSLSPLFLWGYFLALPPHSALPSLPRLLVAFCTIHFCLYTGITAFNSTYDRDKGPVGGMLRPPPPPRYLLAFSLLIQAVGAFLSLWVHPLLFAVYLVIALMGAAYSHPRTRWKASPIASSLTVFIGQGALGFLAGWTTARTGWDGVTGERGLGGMLSAAFTTLGLYPLTQVYQIEEDRSRGDRTLAVALGATRSLIFGLACLMLAGGMAIFVMARTSTLLDTLLVSCAYAFVLWQTARFAQEMRRHAHTITSAFRTVMRLNFITSAGFLVFITLHLLRLL